MQNVFCTSRNEYTIHYIDANKLQNQERYAILNEKVSQKELEKIDKIITNYIEEQSASRIDALVIKKPVTIERPTEMCYCYCYRLKRKYQKILPTSLNERRRLP